MHSIYSTSQWLIYQMRYGSACILQVHCTHLWVPSPPKWLGRHAWVKCDPHLQNTFKLPLLLSLSYIQSTVTYTPSSFGCRGYAWSVNFSWTIWCALWVHLMLYMYISTKVSWVILLYTMFSVFFLQTLELVIIGKCHTVCAALCLSYAHDLTTFQHIITGCLSSIALTCPILSTSVKQTRWLLKLVKTKCVNYLCHIKALCSSMLHLHWKCFKSSSAEDLGVVAAAFCETLHCLSLTVKHELFWGWSWRWISQGTGQAE